MATTNPLPPAAAAPVRFQLRRCHDGSLISGHCCAANAREALKRITLAELMGETAPGPLEWANAELIDTSTGQAVGWTGALVPLDGQSTADGPEWP